MNESSQYLVSLVTKFVLRTKQNSIINIILCGVDRLIYLLARLFQNKILFFIHNTFEGTYKVQIKM